MHLRDKGLETFQKTAFSHKHAQVLALIHWEINPSVMTQLTGKGETASGNQTNLLHFGGCSMYHLHRQTNTHSTLRE
jgi:hypothetical protein